MKKRSDERIQRQNQMERHRKRAIGLKVFGIVLGLLLVVVFGWRCMVLWQEDRFKLNHVVVSGNTVSTDEMIIEAGEFPIGESLFAVDMNQIKAQIKSKIAVNTLYLDYIFPDTISVRIQEKKPVCAMMFDNTVFFIDKNFEILQKTDKLGQADFPVVTGLTYEQGESIGEELVVAPAWRRADILQILNDLKQMDLVTAVSEIHVSDEGYQLISENGTRIEFYAIGVFETYEDYIGTILQNQVGHVDILLMADSQPVIVER